MKYSLSTNLWDKKDLNSIVSLVKSEAQLTFSKNVKKFEEKFSKFIGSKYSVMVNSGSSANLIMIASIIFSKKYNLKKGDEIIVPAVGWSTSYFPLQQYGLSLKFVDVDINTLNYDLDALQKSISKKTRAILLINLLGNPNNYKEIKKLVLNNKTLIIEDNCESLGAKFNKSYAGSTNLGSSYSFYFSHHISTIEGGMFVTNDKNLYELALSIRSHGWTRSLPKKSTIYQKNNKNKFYDQFSFILPGYNLRPTEINAVLGLSQLSKLNKFIKIRRKNASLFQKYFENDENFLIQKEIGESSWFGFSLIIKNNKIDRNHLCEFLINNGIENRPIVTGNFLKSKSIKYFTYSFGKIKNANIIHNKGFFVGNSQDDLTKKIKYLRSKIDQYLVQNL